VGVLCGLELSTNPFSFCPSYKAIAGLPLAERLKKMRDPEVRKAITSEYPCMSHEPIAVPMATPSFMFQLTDEMDYMPNLSDNMEEQAKAKGVPVADFLYDFITEGDGANIIYLPF